MNNRPECARVLLFRGADATALNNQGQLPYHVSIIVGNTVVADVIRQWDPTMAGELLHFGRVHVAQRVFSALSWRA